MSTVGPISFSNPTAWAQFESEGVVATFRSERTTGDTWANRGRGEKAVADVRVDHLSAVEGDVDELQPYARLSGFENVTEWLDAINAVHDDPDAGHVYLVTLRRWRV